MPVGAENINNHAAFIWSVADLLRGDYKQSEYGRVILPFTVLRRLDCVLAPVKAEMLAKHEQIKDRVENFGPVLDALTDIEGLWNTSRFDLPKLLDDPDNLADNLRAHIQGFSPQATDILDKFDFPTQITRLDKSKLLYLAVSKFAKLDLHPDKVSNLEMGYLYEELIRRFSELSNETAGEHFTPRDVIRLMVDLLFAEDDDLLQRPGIKKTLFDPACGTGGMLSVAEDRLRQLNPNAHLEVFGQELNDETYAICRSDMMLKGQDSSNIASGNSFSEDGHQGARFDYLLANPPFGVEWKKVRDVVEEEAKDLGFAGRFGAGTPRINDGSFLFLQHMISKMKTPEDGGSRVAIVFNGSPLFTGAAGSGESEIRRWIIENDWLEAVVALPDQLFYNTGISTYFWIVTNRKRPERKGKVQLIDARESFTKMRKSLGEKRKQIADDQIVDLIKLYRTVRSNSIVSDPRTKFIANDELRNDGTWALEPWMFVAGVRPERSVRLDEIVEFVAQTEVADLPVVRLASLEQHSSGSEIEEMPVSGRRYALCTDGDLIGYANKWAVIPDGFGAAATPLTVLRVKEAFRSNRDLLRLWLESESAGLQTTDSRGRISRRMMVPKLLRDDTELGESASVFVSARDDAMEIVRQLFPAGGFRLEMLDQDLHQLAANASGVRNLLVPLQDVVQRAEYEYPYQIASLARSYRLATTPTDRLDTGLALAESIIRTLGVVAAAVLRGDSDAMPPSVLSHFEGGISTGKWFQLIRPAAQGDSAKVVPDLQLIRFKKGGIGQLLEQCVQIRNEVRHHGGVLNDTIKTEIHYRLEPSLVGALEGVGFMSGWEFVRVRRCEFVKPGFKVESDRLNGSHPDWERIEYETADPIAPDQLYLQTAQLRHPLNLSPFASVRGCSTCQRDEYYVLDKLKDKQRLESGSLKGHRVETMLNL